MENTVLEENRPSFFNNRFDQMVLGAIGTLLVLIGGVMAHGRFSLGPIGGQSGEIVFLATDERDVFQLYYVDPDDSTPESTLLFELEQDIIDFSVSAEADYIVYTRADGNGSHDLGLYDRSTGENRLALECEGFSCTNPVWSTIPSRLIYERRNVPTPNSPPGPSRLWWFDVESGQTIPVFSTRDWLGLGVSFSPSGEWIGYVAPLIEEIQLFNLENGDIQSFASSTGEQPFWHPDGRFYFTEVQFMGENFAVHIFEHDIDAAEEGTLVNLSGGEAIVNDGSMIWAPNGDTAAFTRKPSRTPSGKQLFLFDDETKEITPLTDNVAVHYGPPQWNGVGDKLVYQRFDLSVTYATPEIWVLDLETMEETLLAEGSRPQWIP